MTSTRDGADSIDILRRDAEAFSQLLTTAADLAPTTASDPSGSVTITIDGSGRPTQVTVDSGWQDEIEPADLAGVVQAAAASAEQQRLEVWTARLADLQLGARP